MNSKRQRNKLDKIRVLRIEREKNEALQKNAGTANRLVLKAKNVALKLRERIISKRWRI